MLKVSEIKNHLSEIVAYAGLILTLVVFFVFNGERLNYNIGVVLQTAAPYVIMALGAVFIYSMGYMDVSVGPQVGVYTILMIQVTNVAQNPYFGLVLGFAVVLIISMFCGYINGAVAVWLRLPSIVTSLFLMFVLGGVQYLLMENLGLNSVSLPFSIKPDSRVAYNLILIGAIVLVAITVSFFFNFSRLGKYTRGIGANEVATAQAGVDTTKWKVLAYMFFGVTVSIGSLILLSRTGTAGKGTGGGYAMDIMICLILGGMPLSGGMRSRVKSAIIGTFTYVLLSNNLTTMGVSINHINIVKSMVFILIILLTSRNKGSYLPR